VIQLPDGASLQRTEAVAEKVRAILAAQDGVKDVIPVTGSNFLTGANQSNSAVEFALLKPWNERGAALSVLGAPAVSPQMVFLSAHAFIHGHFHPRRHLLAADAYRAIRSEAFDVWHQETCAQHAT